MNCLTAGRTLRSRVSCETPVTTRIIRTPDDVDLGLFARAFRRPHAGMHCRFQSVQRHVCDHR
jgi:hypothetical protein